MNRLPLFVLTLTASATTPGVALGQTLLEDLADPVQVKDLTGFATTGADMAGTLRVTAFGNLFGAGGDAVGWSATGSDTGAASGTGWSLTATSDTYGTGKPVKWRLDVTESDLLLDRVVLTGVGPNTNPEVGTVFDRSFNGGFGTAGSFLGTDFEFADSIIFNTDVEVTYGNPVDNLIDGIGTAGDVFGSMTIDFLAQPGTEFGGVFTADSRMGFFQDTDLVGERIPCDPKSNPECVPEPASAALALTGLALVTGRRRGGKEG